MFEKTVLRGSGDGVAVTAGQLAEALLFYRQVHIVLDERTLDGLVRNLGVDVLLETLQRPNVMAVYVIGSPATISQSVGPLQVHNFGFVAAAMPNEKAEGKTKPKRFTYEVLRHRLVRIPLSDRDSTKLLRGLERLVPHRALDDKNYIGSNLSSESIIDVLDEQFFKSTVNRVLMESLPENQVPTNFNIKATDSDLGFYVFSDLDLERLDGVRGAYAPQRPNLTLAYLAGTVFTARTDLALAARYGGDFVTSEESSQIIQLRCAALLKRTGINTGELSQFQELVIDDCPTLAEVIDSGDRSFSDFLRLLDCAGRFRDWIGSVHPDRGVARAYLEEVARQDWIQGGAAKSLRYMMGLAIGLPGIDALVGAGVAFADSFLLERLLGGWRPNHFVTKRLLPFLQP